MNKKLIIFSIAMAVGILGGTLVFQFGGDNFSEMFDSSDSSSSLDSENLNDSDTEESSPPLVIILIMILVPIGITFFAFKGLFKHFAGGKERKRILAIGRPARAKIISLGESGRGVVTVNNQPFVSLKLEIYDGNKPPYQVEIKTIIARLDIPRFQPGVMLGVKIDPQNPQNVAIDPAGEGLGNEGGRPRFGGEDWSKQDRELMAKEGINGEAKILNIEDTGESKDFNPIAKITYEVHIKGKSPYKLSKRIALPTKGVNLVKTFVGKNVPVKVHPYDSNKVELKFNP